MKTIARQLKINKFPFEIKDEHGRIIYHEREDGYWEKSSYDEDGRKVYHESINNFWGEPGYITPEKQRILDELFGVKEKSVDITAEEALRLATPPDELTNILSEIKDAAINGATSLNTKKRLTKLTIRELEDRGFDIQVKIMSLDLHDCEHIISW